MLVPVLLPAVLVNALVVFTLVVGNFALAMLLGSRVPLLSVMTYNTFSVSEMGGSPTLQSAMSVVSIAIVAIVLFFQKRVVERKVYTMTQRRAAAAGVRSWPRSSTPAAWVW